MASFFQKIWWWLTGKSSQATATPSPAPSVQPDPAATPKPSGPTLTLQRSGDAGGNLSGTLQEAVTLEDPDTALPAGVYPLSLHREGGLNSAYWFRFPQHHKGMVQIEGAGSQRRYLRLGESGKDAQGGIVIPDIGQYLDLYVKLAEDLESGKSVSLKIS